MNWERILDALSRIPHDLSIHIFMVVIALAISIAISIPVGILLTRPRFKNFGIVVMNILNICQSFPGMAIIALARRYQVSVGQLMEMNQINDPNVIRDGQNLIVSTATDQVQPVMGQQPERIFSWPLAGRITSHYGIRGAGFHHGLDIAGEMGDIIKAARSGRVEAVEWRPIYGETVIIDHGDGYQTLYAHASEYLVEPGGLVETGQGIARVGSTGRSTGPHLHFEVRIDNKAVNPIHYLE
jgi:murein DD-endopeptidase MepM/ murein hydrolase activator NlpD